MIVWGMPFVPSVLALSAIDFSDRFFLLKFWDQHELGLYAIGVRISAALLFLLTAFRTAWPAFAFSIKDEDEARRTFAFVMTYVVLRGVLGGARARPRLALARAAPDDTGLLRGLERRGDPRLLLGDLRRVHRRRWSRSGAHGAGGATG